MTADIINIIKERLDEKGVENVFTFFDGEHISCKGREIYTLIGINGMESFPPIYSEFIVYFPFKADIEIKITAPENSPLETLYNYFDDNIEPVICEMSSLGSCMTKFTFRHDSNIRRLVLTAVFTVNGIVKNERGT